MDVRINIVTLGVASIAASRAFYERLGFVASVASQEGVAFFQLGPVVLSLFERGELAKDAGVPDTAAGFPSFSLAQNFDSRAAVDAAHAKALAGGARETKAPCPTFWGGYASYVADPDGFLWELAHNPFIPFDAAQNLVLPA